VAGVFAALDAVLGGFAWRKRRDRGLGVGG